MDSPAAVVLCTDPTDPSAEDAVKVPRLPWWLAPNGTPPESIIAQPAEQEQEPPIGSYKPTPFTEEELEARLSRAYSKAIEMQKLQS
jgi:hypothetical protein